MLELRKNRMNFWRRGKDWPRRKERFSISSIPMGHSVVMKKWRIDMRDATIKIISIAAVGYAGAKLLNRDMAYHWLIGVTVFTTLTIAVATFPIVSWKSPARYSFVGAAFFLFTFLTIDQGFRWGFIASGRQPWFFEWPYLDIAFFSMAGLAGASLHWLDSIGHMDRRTGLYRWIFLGVVIVASLLSWMSSHYV